MNERDKYMFDAGKLYAIAYHGVEGFDKESYMQEAAKNAPVDKSNDNLLVIAYMDGHESGARGRDDEIKALKVELEQAYERMEKMVYVHKYGWGVRYPDQLNRFKEWFDSEGKAIRGTK